ncbi:MAG: CRISPR-associated endonuclease Cas1 [Candidatus Caenarcaniphilales bacterium]|nr:CRISPR-associated endonuclease Cas1 [Candidatus Caenarcaniphilales bacterium]
MTTLYITEPGSMVNLDGGRILVKRGGEVVTSAFLEKLENIVLVGSVGVTSPSMIEFLKREIPLTWVSPIGRVFGRLEPTTLINIERQREQFCQAEDETFSSELSRRFITAKVHNSRILLSRWNRERQLDSVSKVIEDLKDCEKITSTENNPESLLGYEGHAASIYFEALGQIVPEEFEFKKRTRQPPLDPFNSMLSLSYTLLMYECYTAITSKGLHPYMGFLHKIRRGHPALASDLMEEWRSIICDAIVMDLVSHRQVRPDDFELPEPETGGIYCKGEVLKKVITAFERKLKVINSYLAYVDYPLSFRESLQFQVGSLVKAIESGDPEIYRPIMIK